LLKINDRYACTKNRLICNGNARIALTGLSTSIFLLGEEPTKQVFVGGVIILFGIGMILFSKSKK